MKKEVIETSKGKFILLDVDYNSMTFVRILGTATACLGSEELFDYEESFKLSEITEEQANDIIELKGDRFQDYNHVSCCDRWCNTAIESLHSLLKSKGIHLFKNPYLDFETLDINAIEAEEKTFYNPYIFKL